MASLSILLAGSVAVPASEVESISSLAAAGERALESGDWQRAEAAFRELVRLRPGMADAYEGLARALEEQGRGEEAASVWQELGAGWLGTGQPARAAAALEEAARLTPGDPRPRALLGRALNLTQRHESAAGALTRAVELGDRDLATHVHLGASLWELGRLEEAEQVFRRALLKSGGAPVVRHQLGRLLLWQGRFEEALTHLRTVAARHPDAGELQLDLARALEGAGEVDDALEAFRRAVELAPQSGHARYGLARLLQRTGQRAAAEGELDTYRRLTAEAQRRVRSEALQRARLDRAWDLLRQGEAEAAAERFAELGRHVEALTGVAMACLELGRHLDAAEALERAVELDPDRGDLRLLLDEARMALEREP